MIFEGLPVEFEKRKGQRRLRLRIRNGTIYMSGPWWVSKNELITYLEEQRQWVQRTMSKLTDRNQEILPRRSGELIDVLYLGDPHSIHVIADPKLKVGKARVDLVQKSLTVSMNSEVLESNDEESIQEETNRLIRVWIQSQSRVILPELVHLTAVRHDFIFKKLYIRSQKTKWGTCSTRGNLSLNWKLIQCPRFVIDYLIIHELCHLKEMNHGKAFWNHVADHYPEYETAETWLKRYGSVVFSNY